MLHVAQLRLAWVITNTIEEDNTHDEVAKIVLRPRRIAYWMAVRVAATKFLDKWKERCLVGLYLSVQHTNIIHVYDYDTLRAQCVQVACTMCACCVHNVCPMRAQCMPNACTMYALNTCAQLLPFLFHEYTIVVHLPLIGWEHRREMGE